jgi:hypothetical protein
MKREIEIDIDLSPEELAIELAKMDGDQQARFFNALAIQDVDWQFSWPMQLQLVTDSSELRSIGRDMMSMIGEYSSKWTPL